MHMHYWWYVWNNLSLNTRLRFVEMYRICDISHMRFVMFNIAYAICNIYKTHMRYITYALCKCWISHMRYLTLLLEGLLNDHNGCGRHGWYLSTLMIPIHASCWFLASIHHAGSLLHAQSCFIKGDGSWDDMSRVDFLGFMKTPLWRIYDLNIFKM